MSSKALGMIEVTGFLGSIVAADIAVKAADVSLVNSKKVGGGLTSIEVFGDVGAVKESIRLASEVVKEMGSYVSSNVIANLDKQVEEMILSELTTSKKRNNKEKTIFNDQEKPNTKSKHDNNASSLIYNEEIDKDNKTTEIESDQKNMIPLVEDYIKDNGASQLSDLKVTELRSLAYSMELKNMTKKQIKFAKKDEIIQGILDEGAE